MRSAQLASRMLEHLPVNARTLVHIGDKPVALDDYRRRNPQISVIQLCQQSGQTAGSERHIEGNLEVPEIYADLVSALNGRRADVLLVTGQLDGWRDPGQRLQQLQASLADDAVCVMLLENPHQLSYLGQSLAGADGTEARAPGQAPALHNLTPAAVAPWWRTLGWTLAGVEAMADRERLSQDLLTDLRPLVQRLGLEMNRVVRNLSTRYWVVKAVRQRQQPLQVAALGLKKVGGVTDARVDYPLRALNTLPGVEAVWSSSSLVLPQGAAPGVLILHRQFMSKPAFNQQMERLVEKGWLLVADMDDDPRHWDAYVDTDFYAFRAVHAVTVSTDPMAALMRQWNPHVQVFGNGIFELPLELPLELPETGKRQPSGDHGIRVFFGALNRGDDWRAIRDQVFAAMRALEGQIEVEVIHDREFYDALPDGVSKRFHEMVPHSRYMAILAACDIALLPLADTVFNGLKSDLKFIECCAGGVVPLCSPLVYGDEPRHRDIGVFCQTPEDWAKALIHLCRHPEELAGRRRNGLDYVCEQRMHSHQVNARLAYYQSLLANRNSLEADRQHRLKHCVVIPGRT
jgi:hypothetical protein